MTDDVAQQIQDALDARETANQYGVSKIPYHMHNGTDSPQVDLKSLLNLPVPVANGGTGGTTLTAHGVLIGEGTDDVAVTSAGTTGQVLTSNGASADPTFQTLSSVVNLFGDGSDGNITVSGTTNLAKDTFYDTLIIASGGTLNPSGFRVFAKTSITIQSGGILQRNGSNGTAGTNAAADVAGTGGAGGTALAAGTLAGSVVGTAGSNGGAGRANVQGSAGVAGLVATAETDIVQVTGVTGGNGGAGGNGNGFTGAGGARGAAQTGTITTQPPRQFSTAISTVNTDNGVKVKASQTSSGSGGGGGGGSGDSFSFGGGGGGAGGTGSNGGVLVIASPIITVDSGGILRANGGLGGNGGNGGNAFLGAGTGANGGGSGGPGSGGAGGLVILVYKTYTNNGTVQAAGGSPGSDGSVGTGVGGQPNGALPTQGAQTGATGTIIQIAL